jgi:hypothetical protein
VSCGYGCVCGGTCGKTKISLFLVTGAIEVSRYMSDSKPVRSAEMRLVRAENATAAGIKFSEHFEAMSSDYSVSYSVYDVAVMPTLE